MRRETVYLIPGRDEVHLDYYGNDDAAVPSDAVIIMPGGGYWGLTPNEGEPIALAFMTHGINAFVLYYPVNDKIRDPLDPLTCASLAMLHIRKNAKKYSINPARVFAVGFSAGGHLAGSLGILWHDEELQSRLPEKGDGNRPTGIVLCYPVITSGEYAHRSSFQYLLGSDNPAPEALERFSLEKHVNINAAPAFIMHTSDDNMVPVENALLLGAAYSHAHIQFEMRIYPHGPHGMVLGNKVTWHGSPVLNNPLAARWVSDSIKWMNTID